MFIERNKIAKDGRHKHELSLADPKNVVDLKNMYILQFLWKIFLATINLGVGFNDLSGDDP